MEIQSSLSDNEGPTVTLKNGTLYSRRHVKNVMERIKTMQHEIPNGALLLHELVAKCNHRDHEFMDNCIGRKLEELGFVDPDDCVPASIRDIVLSAVTGEGLDMGFGSPIQN